MMPSLTAPPAPHSFLSRVASASSCAADSGRPVTTETPLPLRPAVSRPTRTRAGARAGARALRRAAGSLFMTTPRKVCVGFIEPSVHSSAVRRQGSGALPSAARSATSGKRRTGRGSRAGTARAVAGRLEYAPVRGPDHQRGRPEQALFPGAAAAVSRAVPAGPASASSSWDSNAT